MANVQLVQKTGVIPLSRLITQQLSYGWALYGSPFDFQGSPAQLMVQTSVPVGEVGEYRLVEKDGKMTMEAQLKSLMENGWTLYGDPFTAYGLSAQAVVKGNVPTFPGPSGSGEIPAELLARIATVEDKATGMAATLVEHDGELLGKASLVNGKVPYDQLPAIPVGRKVNVANQAARLALSVYADLTIAYQSDTGDAWGLDANANPATAANWSKLGNAQALGVSSFNSRTGNIGPQTGDYTTEMVSETPAKRYVTTEQIALWNQAPNPGLIDDKIAAQKTADGLVYETKEHANDTFLSKGSRGAASGVAPLDANQKVPSANLPAPPDISGLIPASQKGQANGVATLDSTGKLVAGQSTRGVANGVAPLDANSRVPIANLPAYLPQAKREWRDVKASRVVGTYYKNVTGSEQLIRVRHKSLTNSGRFTQIVVRFNSGTKWYDFTTMKNGSIGTQEEVMTIVPADWEYAVTTQGGTTDISLIDTWYEMY
jgi:hypothetical protein